jgi:hypothetical protein
MTRAISILLGALLCLPSAAAAQAPYDTATFSWTWGVCPDQSCATPERGRVKCGLSSGSYTLSGDAVYPQNTLPASWVVPLPGTYYCVVTAVAPSLGLESPPSPEILATLTSPPTAPPSPPADTERPQIAFGALTGNGSKRQVAVVVTDNVAVAHVEVYVNGTLRLVSDQSSPQVYLAVPIPMARSVTIEVRASDAANNLAMVSTTVTR